MADQFKIDSSSETLKQRIERRIKELDDRIENVEKRKQVEKDELEDEVKDVLENNEDVEDNNIDVEKKEHRILVKTDIKSHNQLEYLDNEKIRGIIKRRYPPSKVKVSRDDENGYIIYQI